jgi:hypothetical protein
MIYNTEQHPTTRTQGTYWRLASPPSVVRCCRRLAFVEFKCTRSALLGGVVCIAQKIQPDLNGQY